MASRDSAFLWETEMLRSTRGPSSGPGTMKRLIEDGDDWLTVREASAVTGFSSSTIKKLARSKDIPSHLEKTDDGFLRIVSLEGIRTWARASGRETAPHIGASSVTARVSEAETEIDLTEEDEAGEGREIPEGTMLVPLDAWNKMLNQLGNLHEAGQQLAEARERAAKAETEARFLKERLRELREQLEQPDPGEDQPSTQGEVESPSSLQSTRSLVRKIYTDWRRNRRR